MPQPFAKRALLTLTTVNYLNYIDRYILAAVLVSIKEDLGLSDFQAGLLATAFMLPYMLTSPIFGFLGDRFPRPKILSFGVLLWSFASIGTALAGRFYSLMVSRFCLGFGESAFTVTSIPYISDFFPKSTQGRILAIFSTALPVGAALGYVLGGWLSQLFGWRATFFIVGFPGILLGLLLLKFPDPRKPLEKTSLPLKSFLPNSIRLFSNRNFTFTVLGYCAYTFVVGGVAHWIPAYMQRIFLIDQLKADLIFGGIAVLTGLAGTLIGGFATDWLGQKIPGAPMKLSGYSMVFSIPFFLLCLASQELLPFAIFLTLVQFCFFLSTCPINVAILESAPISLRTSAMAISIFLCHILGDAISSPLIGFISDSCSSLKIGVLACTPVILLCGILWILAGKTVR